MPYTPPSKASPPTTTAGSPNTSRRTSQSNARPTLPRSSSYLTRHRRSPSSVGSIPSEYVSSSQQPTPPGTSDDLKGLGLVTNGSVRQSPPPVTNGRGIPSGAVLSPPESPSGSDDEGLEMRGRKLQNLKELKDAVSNIPVRRESSPTRPGELVIPPSAVVMEGMHHSFSTGALDALGSRRGSHARSRSSIEPGTVLVDGSLTGSEENSEDEARVKPPMVRKKSGELVRPALRPPSHRRPSSMPGTPTFSKAVHFDSHLEHVRHFLQVDRPLAVSAGSSPVDSFEGDSEYPFPASEDEQNGPSRRGPPFEWDIITSNFPSDTVARRSLPVRVEKIWMSNDQKSLQGSISVANLAFQKFVACRFTLDYWKTTSEVAAAYTCEIQPRTSSTGHDRWSFTIKLSDLANLETKTLYFCVRYNVNGQEYWDNNSGYNFQVDFRKRHLPQNGKMGYQGAGTRPAGELPRSNRRANSSTKPRPKSMPAPFSTMQSMDRSKQSKLSLDQSMDDFLDEHAPIRLKKKAGGSASDNLAKNVSTPSGQAFGNRYDFSSALRQATTSRNLPSAGSTQPTPAPTQVPAKAKPKTVDAPQKRQATVVASSNGTGSPTTSDYSYNEVLDRFCFFGSKQPTQKTADPEPAAKANGSGEKKVSVGNANGHHQLYHTGPAQHHSLRNDSNPYFANAFSGSIGSSPPTSPRTPLMPVDAVAGSPMRSASPAALAGNLTPRTGTSPHSIPHHGHCHDRYPFRSETHVAAAIRG